jgi:hypothetical protein
VAVLVTVAALGCTTQDRADTVDPAPQPVVVAVDGPVSEALVRRVTEGLAAVEMHPVSERDDADLFVVADPATTEAQDARTLDLTVALALIPYGQQPPYEAPPPPLPPGGGVDAEAPGAPDPAFWLDPDRLTQAAVLIAEGLEAAGVDRALLEPGVIGASEELALVDEEVQTLLAPIGDEQRVLVTDSARLGYFAERYGFVIVPESTDRLAAAAAGRGPIAAFTEEDPSAVSDDPIRVLSIAPGPGPPDAWWMPSTLIALARSISEGLVP